MPNFQRVFCQHADATEAQNRNSFKFIDGTEVTVPGRPPPPPVIQNLSRSPSVDSGIDVASLPECEDHPVTIHTSHLFFICFGVNDKVCDNSIPTLKFISIT